MKKLLLILFFSLVIISFSVTVMAEQGANENTLNINQVQQDQAWSGYNLKAVGGSEIGWLSLNLDDLNNILAANDFPELSDNFFIYGWSGVAGRKIGNRLGALTLKGSSESKIGNKMTGFLINYSGLVYKRGFYATKDLDISAGAMVGAGGIKLRLLSDEPGEFENIIGDIADGRHHTATMEKNFLALNPTISLAYSFDSPVNIGVSAGYLFTYDGKSNWEIAGNEIAGGTLSNFKAFNLTFQVYIGF